VVTAPTKGGKSVIISKLLKYYDQMFDGKKANKILFCYGVKTTLHDELESQFDKDIILQEGLPTSNDLKAFLSNLGRKIIVMDDLIQDMVNSKLIDELFLITVHHYDLCLIYSSQYIFTKGTYSRSLSSNTDYFILLNSMRNYDQIAILARQIYGGSKLYHTFLQIWNNHVKSKLYGYILLDCNPSTPNDLRIRSSIFPDEVTKIYIMNS